MLKRRAIFLLTLAIVLGAFVYGLWYLLNLRFAAGDIYPHYSSFRADPLGTRVYYESLAQLDPLRVRRFIQSIDELPHGRGVTLLVVGLPWDEMSAEEKEFAALETFIRGGGRLVVALYPELGRPRGFSSGTGTNRPAFKSPLLDGEFRAPPINLREKWGFGYEFIPVTRDGWAFAPVQVRRIDPGPLPETLAWHSGIILTNLDLNWRVIYARSNDPVMIERQLGNGSLVIATDSYFVSNEAMREERSTGLLAWLPGGNREIIFNETHLGVQEKAGIATLARRYKLHGGVAALLVLAALFIWKSSVSFQPRTDESPAAAAVQGRESAAGFENLLRRSVAPKNLLQATLDEWHKSSQLDGRVTPPRREKIRAVVEAFNTSNTPNTVDTYREITRILNRKK